MVYSTYKKQRILFWFSQGLRAPAIAKALEEEKLRCSRYGIHKFLKVYQATGSIARQPGSGRHSKITSEIKRIVEEQMRLDDVECFSASDRAFAFMHTSTFSHQVSTATFALMTCTLERSAHVPFRSVFHTVPYV